MNTQEAMDYMKFENRLEPVINCITTIKNFFDKDKEFSELLQGKIDGKNS